jgi:serine/threonine protein kinase
MTNIKQGVVGNKNVAVKRIRSSMTIDQKLFRREVGSQMDVNHENVVRFLGLCSHTVETPMENPEAQGRYIYAEIRERLLCFEFVSNGSLDKYITGMIHIYQCSSSYAPFPYLIFLAASFNSWLTI